MSNRPVILIHGYSDSPKSFRHWAEQLRLRGHQTVELCGYETLTNEVSIKDIAEGFDRALRIRAGLEQDQQFDVVVHSTGMLVIRAWLAAYAGEERRRRLKHLIALAPATFGSPLAHKGRSWLGSIFKGRKQLGPDFLDAGDEVLNALELASPFTWYLAHADLIREKPFYDRSGDTPYVFVFCGNKDYGYIPRKVTHSEGSDGTVRWAGCALNTRKICIDMTLRPDELKERVSYAKWAVDGMDIPVYLADGLDHGDIVEKPGDDLVDMVSRALRVGDEAGLLSAQQAFGAATLKGREAVPAWQQFVIRAVDERGDPIDDYYLEFYTRIGKKEVRLDLDMDVHVNSRDSSFRSLHVNLDDLRDELVQKGLKNGLDNLFIRVIASSGSHLVGYTGHRQSGVKNPYGKWDAIADVSGLLTGAVKLLHPHTTTLIEFKLNREPTPFDALKRNNVCWFA